MTFTPESPRRVDTVVHAAAVVDVAFVGVAFATRFVFPLAAIVDSIADFVDVHAQSASAIVFRFWMATDRDGAYPIRLVIE